MVDDSGRQVRGYRVEGRVQGVGFRWWTRRTGAALGLRGRVRNLADGSVEVHAAGPPEALEALEAELRDGPGLARVTRVEALDVGTALQHRALEWGSFEIDH